LVISGIFRTFASQNKIQGDMEKVTFEIDGREYEPYQLSNEQVLKLLKSDGDITKYPTLHLDSFQRAALEKIVMNRFEYDLCAKSGETRDDVFARFFSNYVNRCPNDFKRAAKTMGREHRYLQSEMFKMCIEYIKVLAEHYDEHCYDPRNQWACKTAKTLITEYNSL
jgi:hypothetical protein